MNNRFRNYIAIFFAGFLLMQIFSFVSVSAVSAQTIPNVIDINNSPAELPKYQAGVDQSIADYLCTPEGNGSDLINCIGRIYRFGVTAGSIALVFFIVIAGYTYITGGEAAKGKAKGMVFSALTGMGIILTSYVLLNFINPSLVQIKTIQPPIFSAADLPSCEVIGFTKNCKITEGPSAGQVVTTGTPSAGLKQYSSLISKYAAENKIDFCALNALLELESSGIYNNVSNGPPNRVDPNHPDKNYYGLPFTRAAKGSSVLGHGIGLGQIFIYGPPPKGLSAEPWAQAGVPSRGGSAFGFSKPLTISDLINPETNIKAAAYHFAKVKLPHHNNNYANAYASAKNSYHGAGSINGVDVNKIYQTKYNNCKTNNQ